MIKLTKTLTAVLLSDVLILGSVFGNVFASELDINQGQTSEIAVDEYSLEEKVNEEASVSDTPVVDEDTPDESEDTKADAIEEDTSTHDSSIESGGLAKEPDEEKKTSETSESDSDVEGSIDLDKNESSMDLYQDSTLDYDLEDSDEEEIIETPSVDNSYETGLEDYVISSGTCGTNLTWTLYLNGDLSINGAGKMTDFSWYTSAPWTEYQDKITSVTFGEGVESIGNYAFKENTGLHCQLVFPSTLTSIGSYAFSGCAGLTGDLTLPEGITYIGNSAFKNCTGLIGTLSLPSTLKTIDDYAFSGSKNLKGDINLPSGLTILGDSAFNNCGKLSGDLIIPEGITEIKYSTFKGCSSLNGTLQLPSNLIIIGQYALRDCSSLTGELTIPDKVKTIEDSAFNGCSGFTGITLGKSVSTIKSSAFRDCTGLRGSLDFPTTVTSIGLGAFYNCSSLTGTLIIPMRVYALGKESMIGPFDGCVGLENIVLHSGLALNCDYVFDECDNAIFHVVKGSEAEEYVLKNHPNSGLRYITDEEIAELISGNSGLPAPGGNESSGNYIADGSCGDSLTWALNDAGNLAIEGIGEMTDFSWYTGAPWVEYQDKITSVTFGEGVESIGTYAFKEITGLHCQLVFPSTLTSIGSYAFSGCAGLTGDLTLPEGMTSIGNNAFENCTGLRGTLSLPSTLKTIDDYAFSGSKNLKGDINLPSGLTALGGAAFNNCGKLTGDLIIPEGITEIKYSTFKGCSSLNGTLQLPSDLIIIGQYALRDCFSLTGELTIPDKVKIIEDSAFNGCSGFTGITLGKSVTTIKSSAFRECTGLTGSLEFPTTVISIEIGAFYNCSGLTGTLIIPMSVFALGTKWMIGPFDGCVGLENIVLHSGLALNCDYVFDECDNAIFHVVKGSEAEEYVLKNHPNSGLRYITDEEIAELISGNSGLPAPGGNESSGNYIADGSCGDSLTWALNDAGNLAIEGIGEMTDFSWYTGAPWVEYQDKITSVTFGEGVESIGTYAFKEITGLHCQLVFPSTLTSIGSYAFSGCAGLTGDLTLPEGMTSIGNNAFENCTGLRGTLSLPSTLKTIDDYAFSGSKNLKGDINLPSGLTALGGAAFNNCGKLTGDLIIPEGITEIKYSTFKGCSSLNGTLQLPSDLIIIGQYAFQDCTSLYGALTIPDKVKVIEDDAFNGCSGFTGITLGNNVTKIKSAAFRDCTGLKGSLEFPTTVTSIELGAFYNCSGFTGTLIIPMRVYALGTKWMIGPFDGCVGLENIVLHSDLALNSDNVFDECDNATFYVVKGSEAEEYVIKNHPKNILNYITDEEIAELISQGSTLPDPGGDEPSGDYIANGSCGDSLTWTLDDTGKLTIEGIGEMTDFGLYTSAPWSDYQDKITSITFAEGVESIGSYAFYEYTGLHYQPVFPSTLISIGSYAFSDCAGLNGNLILPEGLTSIGSNAFLHCTGFRGNLSLPSTLKTINDYAFSGCKNLKGDINLPDRLTALGRSAFESCSKLTGDLIIPEGITEINYSTFKSCSSLNGILQLPSDITTIGQYAFQDCTSLCGALTIPDKVKVIEDDAFNGCSGFTVITLGKSITTIKSSAFRDCTGLTGSLEFPTTVTSIELGAFYNCSGLTGTLIIPMSVDALGTKWMIGPFDGCVGLENIVLHSGLALNCDYVFDECDNATFYVVKGSEAEEYVLKNHPNNGLRYITDEKIAAIISGEYELPKAISRAIIYAIPVQTYTGNAIKPLVTIIYNGENLTKDKDYTVAYKNNVNVGTGTVIISGIGQFTDTVSKTFKINRASISEATITGVANKTYTGTAQTQNPKIKLGDRILTRETDYTLYYANNTNAGIATITITGIGNYEGEITKSFTIAPVSMSSAEVTEISSKTYTGEALTQTPKVTIGSDMLILDTDYTVSYSNNTNAGTARITITGIGNFKGVVSKNFLINPVPISSAVATGISGKTYTGKALTQTPTVTLNSKTLTLDTDYVLSYSNNTNVGTATVTIIGKGNYTGTKSSSFTIRKAAQSIIAKSSALSIAVGKTATVSITGAKGTKSFKSSDTTIATVTSAGIVTAKKVGTVKITATSAATSNYKAASKIVTIKVVPAAIPSLNASNLGTGIQLTWKKAAGATGYKVYRGSTLVKTITSGNILTYVDPEANTNGTKYTFKVIATAPTGISTLSKSIVTYRIERPAISSATNNAAGKAFVKWGKNEIATGYQIQYSTSSTFARGNKSLTLKGVAIRSKVIGSLTKGKTYYIRMRTYKTVGGKTYWSIWSVTKIVKISK